MDSDGDLDIVMPNYYDQSVTVRLNGPTSGSVLPVRLAVATTGTGIPLTVYPNPAHGTVAVEGFSSTEPFVLLDLLGRERYRQPSGSVLTIKDVAPG